MRLNICLFSPHVSRLCLVILCCILNYCTTVGSGEYVKHDGLLNKERDRVKITIVIHLPLCVWWGSSTVLCVCLWWGSSTVLCVCVCVCGGGGRETTYIPNYLCDIKFNIFFTHTVYCVKSVTEIWHCCDNVTADLLND